LIVLVTLQTAVILLLAVLVAGLLRSHADILRRLHDLSAGGHHGVPVSIRPSPPPAHELGDHDMVAPPRAGAATGIVFDVSGATPFDDAISVSVTPARVDTVLAFLSGGCSTCASFWEAFGDERSLGLPGGTRLVVVTRGPGRESPATLRRLSPADVPVIMSDEAWEDYGVPGSPYFIYVNGPRGTVTGEGSAPTWPEVVSLLRDSLDDASAGGRGLDLRGDDREARADRALMASGILPGDPRLYLTSTDAAERLPT